MLWWWWNLWVSSYLFLYHNFMTSRVNFFYNVDYLSNISQKLAIFPEIVPIGWWLLLSWFYKIQAAEIKYGSWFKKKSKILNHLSDLDHHLWDFKRSERSGSTHFTMSLFSIMVKFWIIVTDNAYFRGRLFQTGIYSCEII